MIHLSQAGKLPCRSWSLNSPDTCPGSKGSNGELVDACKGCYATTGCYNFHTTITPRANNKKDWKRDGWVDDMVEALTKEKFFRWFDSGDMYCLELAEKIYEVMWLTPNTKHWLPTRMHKFGKFHDILHDMNSLPNVMVRYSSDSVEGAYEKGHGSTIIPSGMGTPIGVKLCNAPKQGGKCLDCRDCWNRDIPVIGYIGHGHKMAKIIKLVQDRDYRPQIGTRRLYV